MSDMETLGVEPSDQPRKAVVCSILPGAQGPVASVDALADPARSFKDWRRTRSRPFLPVAAIEIDPVKFTEITSWTLPCRMSVTAAAAVFRSLGIPDEVARAFARQYQHLGIKARPLFRAWAEAVG